MDVERFIAIGENIHCTRIYKVNGKSCREVEAGGYAIHYTSGAETKALPVPPVFVGDPNWEAGRVKHCAVAIWQGVYGSGEAQAAGVDYVQALAREQVAAGATYLDINVDEFSTDVEERARLMKWTVETVQSAVEVPVSIDSSNLRTLRAGLEACDSGRSSPMVNSVSLERVEAMQVAADHGAVVIASAAGEEGLPSGIEDRMANIGKCVGKLTDIGMAIDAIHVDPLVFPISMDGSNGPQFLDTVRAVRSAYGPEIHIVAGLSNVSFGMPNRKLINQVFSWLAVEAGADGGIVDPSQINAGILSSMDTSAESFQLARALLLGEDEYGMSYITACRDGKI